MYLLRAIGMSDYPTNPIPAPDPNSINRFLPNAFLKARQKETGEGEFGELSLFSRDRGGTEAAKGLPFLHTIEYLEDEVYTLTVPEQATYAELYFETEDIYDYVVARITIGPVNPTSGTGLDQSGKYVTNQELVYFTLPEELTMVKIIKLPAVNNLRLEVDWYK